MEFLEKGRAALIDGIQADAQAQSEKILEQARVQADEKRKYAEKKIESILKDAQAKGQEQAEVIKRKALSQVELEIKRRSLRFRETLIRDIMDQVKLKLSTLVADRAYPEVLTDWIAEAAQGLGAEAARVNASLKERPLITDALLSRAAKKVNTRTGKTVHLSLSDEPPLEDQGILLTALDGRVAFNNQVKTRMLRRQQAIHHIIYEAVFAAGQEDQL